MSMPLSHFVSAYPSPFRCPQVHSLRLRLYSCPAPRFFMTIFFLASSDSDEKLTLEPHCYPHWYLVSTSLRSVKLLEIKIFPEDKVFFI